jgi:hypothetical protein
MKVVKVICALFIFGFVSTSHAAVIFTTEKDANGTVTSLLGADNVEVNGSFYNVRFLDGTCIVLFNGCDGADDFVFNTLPLATMASRALLDLVFIDGVEGNFDSQPELTVGCEDYSYSCLAQTFYDVAPRNSVLVSRASNAGAEIVCVEEEILCAVVEDIVSGPARVPGNGAGDRLTVAVWSVAVSASAPGTVMIFLMGIAGLLVSHRRKQA